MNKDEAKEIIKQMCAELSFYEDKKDEALELAIKALEKESCNECCMYNLGYSCGYIDAMCESEGEND